MLWATSASYPGRATDQSSGAQRTVTPELHPAARRFWLRPTAVEVLVALGATLMTAATFARLTSRPLAFVGAAVPRTSVGVPTVNPVPAP